jgi:CBS domain-containing protein
MKRLKVQDLTVSAVMTADVTTTTPEADLGDVVGLMKSRDIHEIPVLQRKLVVGIVTMRDLMRRRNLPPSTKVSTVMRSAPSIGPETGLPEAAERMIAAGFRAVPVITGRRLMGILSRTDLVRAIVETEALKGLPVRDLMTPNPQCVAEDETVDRAVQLMRSLGERSVPVVDRNRRLRGVLGLKDLADFFARPKDKEQYGERAGREDKVTVKVGSVMRYPPVTIGPEADVHRAADLMLRNGVSSVIVEEDGRPLGIVTKADLMHVLANFVERDQLFVELSGLEDEPVDTYDAVYAVIQKEMKRIAEIVHPRSLSLHVQKYKPEGDRWKYSLHARFATTHRMYYANHFDWDLQVALDGLLEGLYRRLLKEKERKITERKRHHSPGPRGVPETPAPSGRAKKSRMKITPRNK